MVSELLALKIENCELKRQIQQAAVEKTQAELRAIVEQARAEADAPADHIYNLGTRSFHPPQA